MSIATVNLRHSLLQGFTLVAGMALLGFGVSVLTEYFTDAASAAAYRNAPQCEQPSASATSSCYIAVDATVAGVTSWTSRYGSSYRLDLSLPTGPQRIWLADGPPPSRGAVVGVKLWRGRATLISTAGRLIETTDNPIWLEDDALLRALVTLSVGTGLLLTFVWHWGAVPATGPGVSIDTIGTLGGEDGRIGADPSRLELRPVRRSDAPGGGGLGSLGTTTVVLRVVPLGVLFVGGFIGDPPIQHQRLTWTAPLAGVLVATLAVIVVRREMFLRVGGLFADMQDFGATNWLGMASRWPRNELQRIVVMYVDYQRAGTRAVVLFVSASGSVLLRLPGKWWRRDQLLRLAGFLGVHAENLWDPSAPTPPVNPVTPAQLRARFRSAEAFWNAHPAITAWVLTPIIIVAVCLFVLALQSH